MRGAPWIRLAAAASLSVILGATITPALGATTASATPVTTPPRTTATASTTSSPPTSTAPVVTDALGDRWMDHPDSRPGSAVDARLRLWAVEPLHDVVVTFTDTGPVSMTGTRTLTVGRLDRGGRVVSVPMIVRGQGTGDIHATVTGLDTAEQKVGAEDDLDFASDGSTVTFSISGLLDAQVALLKLRRATLGTTVYQERLVALEGGGATVRIATSATTAHSASPDLTPSTTTVSGQIQYYDSNGDLHPARFITVDVNDADGSSASGSVLAQVSTDDMGKYSASVSTFRADGVTPRQLFIQALAESPDTDYVDCPDSGPGCAANLAFVVHSAVDGVSQPQFMDSRFELDGSPVQVGPVTATGAAISIDMDAGSPVAGVAPNANDAAFDVADALVTAMQYTVHFNGTLYAAGGGQSPLSVEFPTAAATSQFVPSVPMIDLLQPDEFDWDVILHEYGHFVAYQLGIDQGPGLPAGKQHALGVNLSTLWSPPNLLDGTELAWSEGFATYFALVAEDVEDVASLYIPNVANGVYIDTEDSHTYVDYNTNVISGLDNPDVQPQGEDDELSVGRTLWQTYENNSINLSDTAILRALQFASVTSGPATTLAQAVPALLAASGATQFDDSNDSDASAVARSNDLGCILSGQAVSPTITSPSPAGSDTVAQADTPLKFGWSAGGAGKDFPLTTFTVQFWSTKWDTLLYSYPPSGDPPLTATSYTPTLSDWQDKILGTADASGNLPSSINVVVKGSSATTGPYKSCAISLKVDRSTAELTSPDPTGGSLLGLSTGLSSDGTTAVVGSPGVCDGYISAGCPAGSVSFWSLDPGSGIWKQTASFQPGDLGLTGCSDTLCPGAAVLGAKVAMSGDGAVAAATLALDPSFTFTDPGTWSIAVATFALEDGTWVSTGEPSSGILDANLPPGMLDSGFEDPNVGGGSGAYPHEAIALDTLGDELLVADPNHVNTALDGTSTDSNYVSSHGEAYVFAGHGTTGFTWTGAIPDPTTDPDANQPAASCDALEDDYCSSWDDTFGESVALSGSGDDAMMSDESDYYPNSPDFTITETADIYQATEAPDGTRTYDSTPDVITGADVESDYVEEGDGGLECATSPNCQFEDFGDAMEFDVTGDYAFVGDSNHNDDDGSVYVFHNTPNPAVTDYEQVAELSSSDPSVKGLGWSLAVSSDGKDVVAGAPGSPVGGQSEAGKAELFTEPVNGWTDENEEADYQAPDAAPDELFGSSVGISADGSTTFASAPGGVDGSANEATYAGAAYSFQGATLTTTAVTAPDLTPIDGGGVQGTTGETTDLTATVDPVPDSGTVAFTGPDGAVDGCGSVPVDPGTGEATCTLDLSETDTVTNGTSDPDQYAAAYSGSGTFGPSTSAELDVTVVPLLTIYPTTLPTITAGSAQDFTVGLVPIGGIGPLTWSVVTGSGDNLPSTMTLTSSGEFDGTIDTPGSYSFTAQVADASPASQTADEDLTWVVVASGQPTLSITPVAIPVGVVGATYPVTSLKATGGAGGTTWTQTGLPADFTLTPGGQLEASLGAPTAAGSYPVVFTATQATQTATYSTTLVVDSSAVAVPSAPTQVTATLTDPTLGEATLTWDPPADTGAGPITNYWVTTSEGQTNLPVELTAPPAGTVVPAQYVVHELKPGMSETFTVVAVNAYGVSPASAPSNAVVGQGIGETDEVSATSSSAGDTATATIPGKDVSATGYGIGTVTVGEYADDPEAGLAAGQTFVDVSTSPDSAFTQVVVTVCGGSAPGGLDWWNPVAGAWQPVTPQASSGGDCSTTTLSATSAPTLAQLDGTPFALLSDGFPVVAGQGDSDTGTSTSATGSATASTVDGAIGATGHGVGSVTVFDSPGSNGVGPDLADGETYADLSTATSSAFTSVDIRACGPVSPTTLVWWDNSEPAWQPFSGPVTVTGDCASTTVTSSTTPDLSQLSHQISLSLEQGTPVTPGQEPGGWASDVTIGQGSARGGFGTQVAVAADGQTALVTAGGGSAFTEDGGAGSSPGNHGSVEVLTAGATGWTPSAMIVPPTLGTADNSTGDFGEGLAVSADGTTALIAGTVSDQTSETVTDAVFVMHEVDGVWSEVAQLDPPAGDNGYPTDSADSPWFGGGGLALSADGTVAMVDQPGLGAVVFAETGGTWSQQAVLQGGLSGSQATQDQVGASASMSSDGQTIAIGADTVAGPTPAGCLRPDRGEGAVYFYSDSGGTWTQESTFQHDQCSLTSDLCSSSEAIGFSVALSGDGNSAFVASDCAVPTDSQAISFQAGSDVSFGTPSGVYVLNTTDHWGSAPVPAAALSAPEAQQQEYVGRQLGLTGGVTGAVSGLSANGDGSEVLVADTEDSVPSCSGCSAANPDLNTAWVFQDVGGTWEARSALRASANSGWYGTDLSLSSDGTVAAASDINVADSTSTPGRVYLFGLGVGPGDAAPGPSIGGLYNPPTGSSAPTVTSVSPGGGGTSGGTAVTIDGTGFSGAAGVAFGGVPATSYTIDSDSQITTTAPAGSGTVDVQVGRGGNASATSGADQYVYSNGSGPSPLDVVGPNSTMEYGDPVPALTPTYQGFVNGDTAASLTTAATCTTPATPSSPPASYPVTCAGAVDPDYTFTYTAGSVTVTAAPLAVQGPTPTTRYGDPVPTLTPTYRGFVNGDTPASLTTAPTCTTAATPSSPPASYPVTCSGAVDPDYTIAYTAGSVAVTALRAQTISFTPPTTATVGASATLSATGGASGEPVVFTVDPSSTAGVCSVTGVDGSYVTFGAAGTCVVDADQAGDSTFAAAPQNQKVITVLAVGPTGPTGTGYWLVGSDGGVFADGNGFFGSGVTLHLDRPVVGISGTSDGRGYWLVAADGGVFAYGDAPFEGSAVGLHPDRPVVGIAATPDGKGYWLVDAEGGVYAYGDAPFEGSAVGLHPDRPVVGIAATPDGKGYWLVDAGGGVYAYGDAGFHGSGVGLHLDRPVVGIAATPDGRGYWLVGADGGVFAYGDAPFEGSGVSASLERPVVGVTADRDGRGYWLSTSDGGVLPFGDAPELDNQAGLALNRPIAGIAG